MTFICSRSRVLFDRLKLVALPEWASNFIVYFILPLNNVDAEVVGHPNISVDCGRWIIPWNCDVQTASRFLSDL